LAKQFALTALQESVRAAVAEKRQEVPLIKWDRGAVYRESFFRRGGGWVMARALLSRRTSKHTDQAKDDPAGT
jgi:hypothetical protein